MVVAKEKMKPDLKIEEAKPEDAKAILILKRDAWLQAYPNESVGVTIDDIKKGFSDDDLAKDIKNWQRAIASEVKNSDRRTFVAKLGEGVVGYTSPHTTDGKSWLGAMYVAPEAQGQGAGSALIQQALDFLGPNKDIYLNVVSYNVRAIGFYEHRGFVKTGKEIPEETNEEGVKLLPEIEMVRRAN